MISMWSRPEEAAAEAEAERGRVLGLEGERGVVQAQLLHRVAQVRVLVGVGREEAGEDHRLGLGEARSGSAVGRRDLGDRVADARRVEVLDVAPEGADLADRERRHLLGLRAEDAERLDVGLEARAHRADLHARLELAVDDAHERRHAAVGVVPGVEEQRLQRRVRDRPWAAGCRGRSARAGRRCRCPSWPRSAPRRRPGCRRPARSARAPSRARPRAGRSC